MRDPDLDLQKGFLSRFHAPRLWIRLDKHEPLVYGAKRRVEDALGQRSAAYFGPPTQDVRAPELRPPKAFWNRSDLGDPEIQRPMPEILVELCEMVADSTGTNPEVVLVQWYRDFDYIGFHADGSEILGPYPDDVQVSTLSLGSPRWMAFRRGGERQVCGGLDLEGGDLLTMRGTFQRRYQHALYPSHRPHRPRVSLTFVRYNDLPWAEREKTGYQAFLVDVKRPDSPVPLHHGTEKACRNAIDGADLSRNQVAMLVTPMLEPGHYRFPKDFPEHTKTKLLATKAAR